MEEVMKETGWYPLSKVNALLVLTKYTAKIKHRNVLTMLWL
jgi:hypothetical protein